MTLGWVALLLLAAATGSMSSCDVEAPTRALLCHVGSTLHASFNPCLCSHVIFPNEDFLKDAARLKGMNPKLKVIFKHTETSTATLPEGADGLYISLDKQPEKDVFPSELKELATKLDDLGSAKRAKAKYEGLNEGNDSDDHEIILELPAEPKYLAKHYEIKSLSKYVKYFVIPSDNLTDSSQNGMAYHPSRLMGIDDILNADSLVDLVSSMGADHDKIIISLPAHGLQFTLKDEKNNMPGSPVSDLPTKITQSELCRLINEGGWTLEREEDMTAPYAYKGKKWVSFDDATSASIKGKYVLLRNLGGLSVASSENDDWAHSCAGQPLVDVLHHTLTHLARKSRAAQLLSLQDQIHNSLLSSYSGDVQLSPFRIVRVVDRAGAVHVVRKEAKTEFQCSRQGYFTHPSGCNRFYRCVKFNQYSSDFTVFEYDCPAGLAFDERYEVCVWPGSLPDASACKGSSEIAPVPRSRFACSQEGYYADPENCRWFFACLDHQRDGHTPPTAYEFRCPFGLVFDNDKLACDWPWKVAGCGSGQASYATVTTGTIYPGDILEGRLRPSYAQVSDAQVSGGRIPNVEGGLVLGTSLLSGISNRGSGGFTSGSNSQYGYGSGNLGAAAYASDGAYVEDNSGAYVHDPSGDSGGEYEHRDGAQVPYIHQDGGQVPYVHQGDSGSYRHQGDSSGYVHQEGPQVPYVHQSDSGSYKHQGDSGAYVHQGDGGNYVHQGDNGAYVHQGDSGSYKHQGGSGSYAVDGSVQQGAYRGDGSYVQQGAYRGDGSYVQGAYRGDGSSGSYTGSGDASGAYKGDASGAYINQAGGAYSGISSSGANLYQGSTVQQGASGSYTGSGDASGAYKGDTSGAYINQAGGAYSGISSSGANLYQGSTVQQGASGSYTGSGDASGAYKGDTSGAYINQAGGAYSGISSSGANLYQGSTVQQGASGSYTGSGDASGAYKGDTSGAYINQADGAYSGISSSGANLYQGQGGSIQTGGAQVAGGSYLTGGLVKSEVASSGGSSGGAYKVVSGVDHSGDYIHDGAGSYTRVSGGSDNGAVSGGAYIISNSGSVLKTGSLASGLKTGPVGVTSGTYVLGSGYANDVKTAGVDSGAYLGGVGYVSGAKSVASYSSGASSSGSGAYVHDSRGDSGGEYVHQHIPYIHQDGAQVPYIHQSDRGSYTHQGDNGAYIYRGDSGSYKHDGSYSYQGNNGAYVHDSRGDVGYYGGKYTVGQGAYNVKTNLYQGSSGVYGSGAYFHDGRGDVGGAYHQAGYQVSAPVTYGLDVYHQTSPVIHGQDASRQVVQSVGYIQPAVRVQPITVIKAPAVPLKSVQYIQPAVRPVVATVPVPSVVGYEYKKPVGLPVQPVSVSSTPAVPLRVQTIQPVVVSTPAPPVVSYGYRTPALSTVSVPKATVQPIVVSSTPVVPLNPVQYVSTPAPSVHVNTQHLQTVQGYSYNQPSVGLRKPVYYQQPIQNTYVSTPSAPTLIKTQQIHSFVESAKPVVSYQQPISVSTPASPTYRVHPVSQVVYSTPTPTYVSSTPRPITVSSTPVIPLNPVQYNVPCTNCAVSQTARPLTVTASSVENVHTYQQQNVHTYQQQPICTSCATAQTASPITVISTPSVPLNPVQYSTPAPAVVSYSYPKPAVKFETPNVQQTYVYKQPVVQQTYTYKQPAVQQTYTYKQPVVQQTYTYKQPVVQQTYTYKQPEVQQTFTYKQPVVQQEYGYKQSVVTPQVVVSSTPAPPSVSYSYQKPAQPVVYSTPSPVYVSSTVSPITVSSTPVVPLNPVQYIKQVQPVQVSAPQQAVVGYSYPKPALKFETPVVQKTYTYKQPTYTYQQPIVQSVAQPVAVTAAPVQTYTYKRPVVQQTYISKQPVIQQETYSYKQPIAPAPPAVSYTYEKPRQPVVYSSPAPTYVSSTVRTITVSSTPVVPLNPISYVTTPAPAVSYSYPKPSVKFETPVVQQTYVQPQVQQTFTYKQPVLQQQTYGYKQPVVQQTFTYKQPVLQQQTYAYKQPVVQQTFTYKQPAVQQEYGYKQSVVQQEYGYKQSVVKPQVIVSSTPAPPVAIYSNQKPVQPTVYYTSAPSYVSTTLRPITVSSTPVVPLNPVQYVKPVQPTYVSTPSPPVVSYTYQKPEYKTQPIQTYNSVQYQQPIFKVTTPAPPVIVSSTPSIPLNPVQYKVPVRPALVSYQAERAQAQYVKPVESRPIVEYSYVQQTPVSYSYPKPAVRLETPVVVSTPAPPVLKYEQQYIKQVVSRPTPTPISVSTSPVIPYSPVQYVKPVPPRPQVSYSYVSQPTPAPAVVNYEPVRVSTTPAPPVVNYSYRPVSPVVVSTPAPVVYQQPAIKTQTVRPYINVVSSPNPEQYVVPAKPVQPVVSYNYVKPQPFAVRTESQGSFEYSIKQQPIRPAITVTSTPAVPLAPVQYVSTPQPKPIYSYNYVRPTASVYNTPAPVVTETYSVTTPRPAITVTSTPAVPLAPVQYVKVSPSRPIYNYNYVRPTTTYVETPTPVVQTYKVTTPRPVVVQTATEAPFVEYKPVRVRPAVQNVYVPAEPLVPAVQTSTEQQFIEYKPVRVRPAIKNVYVPVEQSVPVIRTTQQPIDYTVNYKSSGFRKTPVVTTTEQPLGVSYYEEYFDSKKTGGYEYKQPVVQFKEERVPVKTTIDTSYGYQGEIHSSSFSPIVVPDVSTAVPARRRPVQTFVNTVEEESYYSSAPQTIDVNDENLNVHLDIPRVGVQLVSSTTPEQVVEVTTVAPAVKRVRVGGGSNVAGGYYVRKQKVRVRPVVTTTANYPAFFTTTVKPVYSSTIDLTSPTLYSTTLRPTFSTTYRPTSTIADNELEVEDEDDSKLIQEVSGGFGSVLTSGDNGIIRQGSVSSTTISSLKDGEAIVGVVKKEREQFTGRRRTKVVVVSRLSDFNPLLVGKLGAECSCRDESKTLDLTKTRTRGQLFRPVTSTVEPSREYLPTSTTPLPDDLTNFDYDDTRAPGSIVEIKPVRKVQRVYSTTGAPLEVSTVEYVSSTRPARRIASASDGKSTSVNSSGRSTRLDPNVDCQRPGLFRHPHLCNKFYSCNWDEWKKRYTVSVFDCPIHLAFDSKLGACNWPSKGPACAENNLLV